jgi:hypothetical protein
MDLWNEYEGKILAEPYPLEKLIYLEGRSGFFLTSHGNGAPAVVRLTQTSSDDGELLAQWHAVAALNEPHLVALKSFGETVLDRVPVTFAVMERPDATLAEILRERPMTAAETRQIAAGVVPALRALHEHGLAHGHLDSASVVAIGETIKVRSDCARKIANHDDAAKLKERDVRDLAVLLCECLTQKRVKAGELPQLPEPFDRIALHGLSGAWGLDDISRALEPATPSVPGAVASAVAAESETAGPWMPASVGTLSPEPEPEVRKGAEPTTSPNSKAEARAAISVRDRNFLVATAAVTVLIVLWLCIHLVTGHIPEAAIQGSQTSGAVANSAVAPAPAASSTGAAAVASIPSKAASWRIVAYSFRREDEATEKAKTLQRKHPGMDPEVVRATGRLPYLVTLGGQMTRTDALGLEQRLHAEHFHHAVHLQEISAK